MAQAPPTKQKSAKTASRAKPKSNSSGKSRAKPKPGAKPSPNGTASNGKVTDGRSALPLVAGGAALVGAAGGIALGAAKSGSKILGVRLPQPKRVQIRSKDLSKAAKRVGSFGDQVGELTSELRGIRHDLGDEKGNSPLEILLKGLTERR